MLEWIGGYMDIGTLINNALNGVGLPNFYIKREDETIECIVYNYIETPNGYGDMKEMSTRYIVLLNVYCKSKLEATKKKVKEAMLNAGFKKVIIPKTVLENEIYNTAMQFKIAIVNQG